MRSRKPRKSHTKNLEKNHLNKQTKGKTKTIKQKWTKKQKRATKRSRQETQGENSYKHTKYKRTPQKPNDRNNYKTK